MFRVVWFPGTIYHLIIKDYYVIEKVICLNKDSMENDDLSKDYWNPKRKLGIAKEFFRDT